MTPLNAETGHGKTLDSGQRGKGQWLELFLVQTHTLNSAMLHKALIAQEFVWSQYHDRVNVLYWIPILVSHCVVFGQDVIRMHHCALLHPYWEASD